MSTVVYLVKNDPVSFSLLVHTHYQVAGFVLHQFGPVKAGSSEWLPLGRGINKADSARRRLVRLGQH